MQNHERLAACRAGVSSTVFAGRPATRLRRVALAFRQAGKTRADARATHHQTLQITQAPSSPGGVVPDTRGWPIPGCGALFASGCFPPRDGSFPGCDRPPFRGVRRLKSPGLAKADESAGVRGSETTARPTGLAGARRSSIAAGSRGTQRPPRPGERLKATWASGRSRSPPSTSPATISTPKTQAGMGKTNMKRIVCRGKFRAKRITTPVTAPEAPTSGAV